MAEKALAGGAHDAVDVVFGIRASLSVVARVPARD
jgi:hypothetical protein